MLQWLCVAITKHCAVALQGVKHTISVLRRLVYITCGKEAHKRREFVTS